MAKKEAVFTTNFGKSFEEAGGFFHKIADMPHFGGSNFRFDRKKPFDLIINYLGVVFVAEIKSIPRPKSFGIKNLLPHQIEGLNSWERNGGKSFVILHISEFFTGKNVCMLFPWAEFKLKGRYTAKDLGNYTHFNYLSRPPEYKKRYPVDLIYWSYIFDIR